MPLEQDLEVYEREIARYLKLADDFKELADKTRKQIKIARAINAPKSTDS